MRIMLFSVLALLCLPAVVFAAKPTKLSQALKNKTVKVTTCTPKTFGSVVATITNISDSPVTIIPLGSSIIPNDDDFQRLALAFSETRIFIKPRTSWTGNINTVCRDELLESPAGRTAYGFTQSVVSAKELEILNFWESHAYLPQLAVNKVIWGTTTFDNLKSLAEIMRPIKNNNSGVDASAPVNAPIPFQPASRQTGILDDDNE